MKLSGDSRSSDSQLLTPFRPAWWLPGAHLQTLWGGLLRSPARVGLERERFELQDGDFLDLDWLDGTKGEPLIVLLHGLAGSAQSPYMRGALAALKKRGLRAVVMHFRGCGGEPNRLARGYHSGETEDLGEFLRALVQREPNTQLGALGFSLGGNVLLKHLGEQGAGSPIGAALAVSVPYELSACSGRLDRGLSRLYRRWLLGKIRRDVLAKEKILMQAGIDVKRVIGAKTLRELDEFLTAPLHGFKSPEDYYQRCSSRQFMPAITKATLLVHAIDDPFLLPRVVPKPDECGPLVEQMISARGGHVGFLQGRFPGRAQSWLDGPPLDWLAAQLTL